MTPELMRALKPKITPQAAARMIIYRRVIETEMSIKLRKEYLTFISDLSNDFYCACFDISYDNNIHSLCGTATTYGFGYV